MALSFSLGSREDRAFSSLSVFSSQSSISDNQPIDIDILIDDLDLQPYRDDGDQQEIDDGDIGWAMSHIDDTWELEDSLQSPNSDHQVMKDESEMEEQRQEALFEELMHRRQAVDGNAHIANRPASAPQTDGVLCHNDLHPSVTLYVDDSSAEMELPDTIIEDDIELPERRRETAKLFLLSLIADFMGDMERSVKMIGREKRRQRDAKENKGMKRKLESGQSEVIAGITMCLKSRRTGAFQNISYPNDPIKSIRSSGQTTALEKMSEDIFYRDKPLFKRQPVVNKIVDDIVATAGLKRRDFSVCASAKGLIAASSLIIHRRTGNPLEIPSLHALLIDPIEKIDHLEAPEGVDWVLVVEKDAVFQGLCSARLLEDPRLGSGVLITGKGFPDLATRQLLRFIADSFPEASFHALVDADPHGLCILSNYTYGSKANSHSSDHEDLALGNRLKWMGLKATDWSDLEISYKDLIPLEKADVQLATSMIRREGFVQPEWRRELCQMLHLNCKAEIEILMGANLDDDVDINAAGAQSQNHSTAQSPAGVRKLIDYITRRLMV